MRTYVADLHLHTCLSPCGALTMAPRRIVETAVCCGIDIIAVTDHNTAGMVEAVARVAAESGLSFLYGIELQTREEVHLLGYFDDSASCRRFSDMIYGHLPPRENDVALFGDQVVVDGEERILRFEARLLLNSLDLSIEEAVGCVLSYGGLPVPAHVDRSPYGLIVQLGLRPAALRFPLVEADAAVLPDDFRGSALLWGSDAHRPTEIGKRTTRFVMERVTVEELRLAAAGVGGRSVSVAGLPSRRGCGGGEPASEEIDG